MEGRGGGGNRFDHGQSRRFTAVRRGPNGEVVNNVTKVRNVLGRRRRIPPAAATAVAFAAPFRPVIALCAVPSPPSPL